MTESTRARGIGAAILAATFWLPLLGAWVSGRDLQSIFTFPPPISIPTDYPRFSWWAATLVIAPFAALAVAWIGHSRKHHGPGRRESARETSLPLARSRGHGFPSWGWVAIGWTIGWWILAWTRFTWFAPLQGYTFFPLWLGFVISINAITQWRRGSCLVQRTPRLWAALFATSAAFWWLFEWLNRFTHNWHYLGISNYGALGYAVHATLCFSTVLPAVTAVAELLGTLAPWRRAGAAGPPLRWVASRWTGFAFLVIGAAGLFGAGAQPTSFYAALWAAPLALLLADDILAGRRGLAAEVAAGDWRRTATWAVAALGCGFFWELWNVHSAAKWIYTVPFTERWRVFEMPLLGYAGYLPFGLECYGVIGRIFGTDPVPPFSRVSST